MDSDAPKTQPKPVEQPQPKPVERPKRVIVDERQDIAIQVGHSTVIFRPGQHLDNAHLRQLASDRNIATREV